MADHYELDKELLTVEQDMFRNFRDSNDDIRLESAVDVLGCMHENGLNDFLNSTLCKGGYSFEHHSSHFMHIREVFQRPQTLENLHQKYNGAVSNEQSGCHLH